MSIHYVIAKMSKDHALTSSVCTVVPYLTVVRMHRAIMYKETKANTLT